MYRLLIVDDEKHVIEWLYELLSDRSELELEIFTANSGKKALEILDMVRIDILLSDIRMPGMTGLELVERVNENWPDAKVIFLTGYHDFDSAYKAIKSNIINYLLKTEDDEEIIGAVQKAIAAISDDLRHKVDIEKALNADEVLVYMLQREMLRNVLNNRACVSAESLKQIQSSINASNPTIMLLGQVSVSLGYYDGGEQIHIMPSLKRLTGQILSKSFEFLLADIDETNAIWMFQPLMKDEDNLMRHECDKHLNKAVTYLGEMLESLQAACMKSFGMSISLFLNENPVLWNNAAREYQFLKQIAQAKTETDINRPIIYTTTTNINKMELLRRDIEIVARIKTFVDDNLDGELSLLRISQSVNYNPSYVSRIFKQINGTNLSDYVLEARINKAKEMLSFDTENILNISKRLSFNTPQYFSTVFKKITGMTPNEFRSAYYKK